MIRRRSATRRVTGHHADDVTEVETEVVGHELDDVVLQSVCVQFVGEGGRLQLRVPTWSKERVCVVIGRFSKIWYFSQILFYLLP